MGLKQNFEVQQILFFRISYREPETDDDEEELEPEALCGDNDECTFWRKFFGAIDPILVQQYNARVSTSTSGIISWDFWVQGGGYLQALKKATSVVRDGRIDYLGELLAQARKVRDKRRKELNKRNWNLYKSHWEVLQLWKGLCTVMNSMVDFAEED